VANAWRLFIPGLCDPTAFGGWLWTNIKARQTSSRRLFKRSSRRFEAGIELLMTLERTHVEIEPALAALRVDIEQDQTELKALMDRLNIAESGVRKIGGWLLEKTTQLKMRIDDRPGGVLHLFESLEALSLGIEGKLALWRTLKTVADLSPDLACSDYQRLMNRAIEQRSRAEALRLQSAITALGPT